MTRDEAIARLGELASEIRTQDNAITAHPVFVVQERKRIYGMDRALGLMEAWIDEETRELSASEVAELDLDGKEERGEDTDVHQHVAYIDEWLMVQPFFTRMAAEDYIKRFGHRHRHVPLRVYVDSAHANAEWKLLRECLAAIGGHNG